MWHFSQICMLVSSVLSVSLDPISPVNITHMEAMRARRDGLAAKRKPCIPNAEPFVLETHGSTAMSLLQTLP